MRPGRLDKRAIFEKREQVTDGAGNHVGVWPGEMRSDGTTRPVDDFEFRRWCHVHYLRGGETVMAGRLQGKQSVIVTVRKDPETETITPDWRLLISGVAYNIREPSRPSDNRLYYELLAENGVATG